MKKIIILLAILLMGFKAPTMRYTDSTKLPRIKKNNIYKTFGREYALRAYFLSRSCWLFYGYGLTCGTIKRPYYRGRRIWYVKIRYIGWF